MAFQPGQSGNPTGRPKSKIWRDALMLVLNRPHDEEQPKGKTNLDKLVLKQFELASQGDSQSIRDIADRLDGKPAQAIIGGDEGDNPLRMINIIELIAPKLDQTPDSDTA